MSHIKRGSTRYSDDILDNDSDDKDSKRKSRNLSEKKRRDQFNLLVNELSVMVSTGSRKMDKSTVLKATIAFLKNHNEVAVRSRIHEIQEDWKPTFLSNEEFTHLILEAVDGFILVFSTTGQIFYASENMTSLLGHLPNDVLGMTIYELTSEEEQNDLYNILLRGPNNDEGQLSFSCHLRRGTSDALQTPDYELVHFAGYFRSDSDTIQTDSSKYSGYSETEPEARLLFVGTGRLQTPQLIREMPLVESYKSEFTSRHSLEWKFLFLDHRAPPIIGYLPFELLGTSGYDYYHIDDLERVLDCHEALMKKGEGTSCYYRFLTKGQQWIWLQTRFYITYHQWNSKPEFVVCTHRLINYVDVMRQGMKEESIEFMGESVDNNSSVPWSSRSRMEPPSSDCTSMSADSPTSRHSVMTQHSMKSKASVKSKNLPTQSSQMALTTFLEPPQYVAAIPVQPVLAGIPPPAVLSPHPSQVDWQRKHAELQAIIGQQQAELRRVSEQLLIARHGIIPAHAVHSQANDSSPYNSGAVSSTTMLTGLAGGVVTGAPSVIVPAVTMPITIPISQTAITPMGGGYTNTTTTTPEQ
ncbi:circadian locomoter output cycles protein kaput isoform X2 [Atheta coriaria]|uniref:circadian locomoter output cycles protein kaput isoform X2 n=1 Tax=Dalotia coriaria TaxID=877792 RepID=UPI0031F451AA